MSIVKLLGIFNEVIMVVLKCFMGVKYCLEYVIMINNCKFYNDLKVMNMLVIEKVLFVFI